MARRLPSTPPILPGFSYMHVLGSGGFADVFCYEQNMPRRQVAVKVMLRDAVDDRARRMFQAETNLMAQLSAHPAILTVYEAGISADGRPYLVMELCSPALASRYRSERIPVAEVLSIAIKIGSAIETAHRAGVLHRDIKPSNVLLTAYGHPVLSDFGIASTLSNAREQESVGMSVPWSAPEVLLDETTGTIASEIWSFAATVYSLLAGRSPFEVPGGDNSSAGLVGRIARARPRAIDRADVPASLEQLLRSAMVRDPARRPVSVLELVRGLQSVETQLGLAPTPAEIVQHEWTLGMAGALEDRTELRPIPDGSAPRPRRRPKAALARAGDAGPAVLEEAAGLSRPTPSPRATPAAQRRLVWVLAASAALAIVLGVVAVAVIIASLGRGDIPVVRDIEAAVTGTTVEFSWDDPGLEPGDKYQIRTREGAESIQDGNRYIIDAEAGSTVCVTVRVNRQGSTGAASTEKCVEITGG